LKQEKPQQEMFHELCYYTIAHSDPSFIHQYAVDAFTAQNADKNTKQITLAFALIGLYLHIEKNFSGKEVQNAHIKLGKYRKQWPKFNLPEYRGNVTISDVLAAPHGSKLDEAIIKWSASVWEAHSESHEKVAVLVQKELWNDKYK
jgi:hypothetical protein